jgi:hypothetical protein
MKISIMTPKEKKIKNFVFPSFSSKNLSFEIFSRKFPIFFIFSLQLMKNFENSLTKNYPYGNASREKNNCSKAAQELQMAFIKPPGNHCISLGGFRKASL